MPSRLRSTSIAVSSEGHATGVDCIRARCILSVDRLAVAERQIEIEPEPSPERDLESITSAPLPSLSGLLVLAK